MKSIQKFLSLRVCKCTHGTGKMPSVVWSRNKKKILKMSNFVFQVQATSFSESVDFGGDDWMDWRRFALTLALGGAALVLVIKLAVIGISFVLYYLTEGLWNRVRRYLHVAGTVQKNTAYLVRVTEVRGGVFRNLILPSAKPYAGDVLRWFYPPKKKTDIIVNSSDKILLCIFLHFFFEQL